MMQLNAEKIKLFGQVEAVRDNGLMIHIFEEVNIDNTGRIDSMEWLPKSQIEIISDTRIQDLAAGDKIIFLLPAWLALERGLFDD